MHFWINAKLSRSAASSRRREISRLLTVVVRINSRRAQPSEETRETSRAKAFSYFYLPWRSFTGPRRIPRKLCARLLASGNIVWRVTLWSEVHRPVFVSEGASKCKIKVNSLLSSLAWNKETIFAPCLRLSFTMLKRLSHESPVCRQTSYWNITTQYRSRTPFAAIKENHF